MNEVNIFLLSNGTEYELVIVNVSVNLWSLYRYGYKHSISSFDVSGVPRISVAAAVSSPRLSLQGKLYGTINEVLGIL